MGKHYVHVTIDYRTAGGTWISTRPYTQLPGIPDGSSQLEVKIPAGKFTHARARIGIGLGYDFARGIEIVCVLGRHGLATYSCTSGPDSR